VKGRGDPGVTNALSRAMHQAPAMLAVFALLAVDGGAGVDSALAMSGHGIAHARDARRPGAAGAASVTFNIPNRNNRNIKSGWHFTISVGGGRAHVVQVDTGSASLVIPARILGPQAVGPGAPAKIEYSSSGRIFSGHHYMAPVKLSAGTVSVTTVPIDVLAIESASCDPKYPACRAGSPNGVGVMGVGFGRGHSTTPPAQGNVFLALDAMVHGSMHPGYIIRPNSVTLGITAANEAGFTMISLKRSDSPGDWSTEPGCFAFPQASGADTFCGTMLVDTGLGYMIVEAPPSQVPAGTRDSGGRVPDGTPMRVAAPSASGSALDYSFSMGDGATVTPPYVRWSRFRSGAFVNTGRHLIAKFAYLFDAANGRVGFKPVSPAGDRYSAVLHTHRSGLV
jgi:hypothetical protein